MNQNSPDQVRTAVEAVHTQAPSPGATDWDRIVTLYDLRAQAEPSPMVELNRAVAVAMRDGPGADLDLIDAIPARGELADYHLAHAAKADLCRRLKRSDQALVSYRRALALTHQTPERRFLERRMVELSSEHTSSK